MSVSAPRRFSANFEPAGTMSAVRRMQSPNLPGSTLSSPRRIAAPLAPVSTSSSVRRVTVPASVDSRGIWGERQIKRRSISADRIKANDITQLEIGVGAVGTSELVDGNVTPAKLDRAYQEALPSLQIHSEIFRDDPSLGAGGRTTPVVVNDEDAASFAAGVTQGVRCAFEIPLEYDATKDLVLYLRFSESGGNSTPINIEVDHRVNGGGRQGVLSATLTPPGTANEQSLQQVFTFSAGTLSPGDGIAVIIRRLDSDTNPNAMRLFRAVLRYEV